MYTNDNQIKKIAGELKDIKEDIQNNDSQELDPELEKELAEIDKVIEELETGLETRRAELKKQLEEEGLDLDYSTTRQEMRDGLLKMLEKFEADGNIVSTNKAKAALQQLDDSETMEFLNFNVYGVKLKRLKKKQLAEIESRANNKLSKSKRFIFKDIKPLNSILRRNLPEEYVPHTKIFLYKFYYFILENKLISNAILISRTINNIYLLDYDDFDERDKIISNIVKVIDKVLKGE